MHMKRLLSESITHIEDLSIGEFIDVLRNLGTMSAQEKLDGANLWTGLDEEGKFYTSREGKRSGAERRYSEEDWPKVGAFNQFRAAHLALEQKQQELKLVLRSGDTVEVEVLYGRQPNSVIYGQDQNSFIAFLRGVNGTPDTQAEQLSTMLANQQVTVKFEAVDTNDGQELELTPVSVNFKFTSPQQIDPSKLKGAASIDKELGQLEGFLRDASPIEGMTNFELATAQLGSIPKDKREAVKAARTEVLGKIQADFKIPIKNALLDKVVRQLRSGLTDPNAEDDIGIEGIVLRNPMTGKQVKIVDKDVFTAINKFNQSARGEVQSALNTTDPDAPLESRGGLTGELRIRIADALGNREFAKGSNLRKILEPIKGETPEDAIKNFAKTLNVDDFQAVKRKILAMTAEAAKGLADKLESFKQNKDNYRLKLKDGREMGLSDDTVKKTLISFAEARKNLTSLFDRLKGTKSLAQLLAVLYGSQARAVHAKEEEEELKESVELFEKKGEIDLSDFENKDMIQLVNSYLATVFMTMLIWHTNDTLGMRRLRDRRNYLMKKHAADMSPLNHWGYAIWRTNKPDLKKHVDKKVLEQIAKAVKDIPKPWSKFLHMDFSYDNEVKVDWDDHKKTLSQLIKLTGLHSDRLNSLLDMSIRFGDLDLEDQRKLVKKLNAFAHQFVPRSSLYVRTKAIERKLKDAEEKIVVEGSLLKSIAALSEDGEGVDLSGGAPNGLAVSTTASAAASLPVRILDTRRRVEKRTRNPEVKDLMMKFKDPRKETKETE